MSTSFSARSDNSAIAKFTTSSRVADALGGGGNQNVASYQRPATTHHTTYTSREDWILPTSRLEYIKNHPYTQMAKLHSDDKMIAPLWTRITKSAWEDRAKLCSGYGVAMERTKTSADAPDFFRTTYSGAVPVDVENQQSSLLSGGGHSRPRFAKTSFTKTFSKGTKDREPNESAYVLPGGQSILEAATKSKETIKRANYRVFVHGKQALIDNLLEEKPPTPIRWDSNTNTGRSVLSGTNRYNRNKG